MTEGGADRLRPSSLLRESPCARARAEELDCLHRVGDDLHHVESGQLVLFLALRLEAVVDHGHAERAGDGDRVRVGLERLLDAAQVDALCRRPPPSTCGRRRRRSTSRSGRCAPSRADSTPGIVLEDVARRLEDVVVAAEIAGVVVGDGALAVELELELAVGDQLARPTRWRGSPRSCRRTAGTRS